MTPPAFTADAEPVLRDLELQAAYQRGYLAGGIAMARTCREFAGSSTEADVQPQSSAARETRTYAATTANEIGRTEGVAPFLPATITNARNQGKGRDGAHPSAKAQDGR